MEAKHTRLCCHQANGDNILKQDNTFLTICCVYLTSTAISSSVVVDTATEVYDMVDDQYYEIVDVHSRDNAEYTDISRILTSDGYLIPVQTDRSSEHYADHTVQTDSDCIENSTTDIDDVIIKEKDINGSENCDFAYITDAEIVYNGEPPIAMISKILE